MLSEMLERGHGKSDNMGATSSRLLVLHIPYGTSKRGAAMLFLLPIHLGQYSVYLRTFATAPASMFSCAVPALSSASGSRLPWLPIMRPEHLRMMHEARHLFTVALPLPFRILHIELYRNQED
jgi:hypothetical protein